MKIAIGIPCNRQIKTKTVESLFNLIVPYGKELIVATEGYTISENRSYIVAQALSKNCTHLLFIDDDMVFPEDTFVRLLRHEKDVVGIKAHSRCSSPKATVELMDSTIPNFEETPSGLFQCRTVGAGVLLINLDIFKKIKRPWFNTETHEIGWTKMGEDSWFCRQARAVGVDIFCDASLEIGHIGDYIY